jgi:hypothetical protein
MYGFNRSFIVKRFFEECRRTTLKSLSAGRWVVVSGYEDDRDSAVIRGELLPQFQAAHPGQADRASNNPACVRDKTEGTLLQRSGAHDIGAIFATLLRAN